MQTLQQLRNSRKFLTGEQTEALIRILASGLRKAEQLRFAAIVRNSFYSLEDRDYWRRFHVEGNYIIYKPFKESFNGRNSKELKEIRIDIFNQSKETDE